MKQYPPKVIKSQTEENQVNLVLGVRAEFLRKVPNSNMYQPYYDHLLMLMITNLLFI